MPMIDVMTVLIFFFLLTMQFKDSRSVEITPPQMASAEAAKERKNANVVAVSNEGEFFFGGEKLSAEALGAKLKDLAASDEKAEVVLLGDEKANFGDIALAIDLARVAKIRKLSIRASSKK